jgi:hypothetical protein
MKAHGVGPATAVLVALAACGEPRVAVVPADAYASFGIVRGPGAALPQSSGAIRIRFLTGDADSSTVVAQRVSRPIVVDGDDSDWAGIPASVIPLRGPAAAVGLTPDQWTAELRALWIASGRCASADACELPPADDGLHAVSVRAAYDDERIWLVLRWSADAANGEAAPWVWTPSISGGAWSMDLSRGDDRAVVSFGIDGTSPDHDRRGCAAACHLGEDLGDVAPEAWPRRARMHTGSAGERLDAWEWRAARTDPLGLADDLHVVEAQAVDVSGVRADCPDPPSCTAFCVGAVVPVTTDPPIWDVAGNHLEHPLCGTAPWTPNPLVAGVPRFMAAAGASATPAALLASTAVTYAAPSGPGAGARIPSVLLRRPSAHRDDVEAKGRWDPATRTWTLELGRKLVTGDPNDAQFPIAVHAPSSTTAGTVDARFSALRDQVLVPRCGGCHSAALPPALTWAALVGQPSPQAPGGMPYVTPGDPSRSWLLVRMRGASGAPMPPDGALDAGTLSAFETWIRNGAKDD